MLRVDRTSIKTSGFCDISIRHRVEQFATVPKLRKRLQVSSVPLAGRKGPITLPSHKLEPFEMTFFAYTTMAVVAIGFLATVESYPFDQGKRLTNDRAYYFKAPWKSGIVPYYISTDFESSQMDILRKAMDTIESVSCVKFVPLREAPVMPQQDDYIYLLISRRQGQGCRTATLEHAIQNNNGIMELILDTTWCMEQGKIIHELMHSLGFGHEHQRPDRDDYINIVWENLENVEEAVMQFSRSKYSKELLYEMPYDLVSIMHYARRGYVVSVDPDAPVIVPKIEEPRMGQREALSDLDIKKINYAYSCGANGPTTRAIRKTVPSGV